MKLKSTQNAGAIAASGALTASRVPTSGVRASMVAAQASVLQIFERKIVAHGGFAGDRPLLFPLVTVAALLFAFSATASPSEGARPKMLAISAIDPTTRTEVDALRSPKAERWCERPSVAPVFQLRTTVGTASAPKTDIAIGAEVDFGVLLGVRIMDLGDLRFGPVLMSLDGLGHTSRVLSWESQFVNYTSAHWNNVQAWALGYDLTRRTVTFDFSFMPLDQFLGTSKTWQLAPCGRFIVDGRAMFGTIGVAVIFGSFGNAKR